MLDGAGYARLITEEHYNDVRNLYQNQEIAFDPTWEEYYNSLRESYKKSLKKIESDFPTIRLEILTEEDKLEEVLINM